MEVDIIRYVNRGPYLRDKTLVTFSPRSKLVYLITNNLDCLARQRAKVSKTLNRYKISCFSRKFQIIRTEGPRIADSKQFIVHNTLSSFE